jgi:hypothetical protein
MPNVIYSIGVSLDGFIAGPNGEIDWSAPDEELHRFHNQQARELGAHLCGRRLYQEMLYWETADQNPSAAEHELEFARIWRSLPKIVFSKSPREGRGQGQAGHGRRCRRGRQAEGATGQGPGRRRRRPGLHLHEAGPHRRVPALRQSRRTGWGHAVFPGLDERVDLELVETQTFGSRVVYVRYRRG